MDFFVVFTCHIVLLSAVGILWKRDTAVVLAFDFFVVPTKMSHTNAELHCKALGYDGLAVASTPEAFNLALEMSEPYRAVTEGGVEIGLTFDSATEQLVWADGSHPASDTPFSTSSPPVFSGQKPYGRIKRQGYIGLYDDGLTEVKGSTHPGFKLGSVSSILAPSPVSVSSYIKCVSLCGRDNRCRAAEFDSDLLTCKTFGPAPYYDLAPNTATTAFVRVKFAV